MNPGGGHLWTHLPPIDSGEPRHMVSWSLKVPSAALAATVILSSCAYANSGRPPTQALPAPGASVTTSANDALVTRLPAQLKEAGILQFVTEASYPPMAFIAEDELTIAGADVDLGNAIADKLGLESQWVNAAFPTLLPGVADGKYPVAMSALTITAQRLEEVTMVSYLLTGTSWATLPGNPDGIDPSAPCGSVVAVQTATVQDDQLSELSATCQEQGREPVRKLGYALESDVYRAVIDGSAQALVADTPVVAYAVAESDGAVEVLGEVSDTSTYGIALGKSEVELAEVIAAAIAELIADGTYAQILAAWNLTDAAISNPQVNPDPAS